MYFPLLMVIQDFLKNNLEEEEELLEEHFNEAVAAYRNALV